LTVLVVARSAPAGGVDWKKALEQPLSPGSIAILTEEGHRPEVQARWRAALSDPSARNRAAAACAIYGAGAAALVPDVTRALASETSRDAADEEARVVAVLDPAHCLEPLLAAAKRLPRLRHAAGDLIGRARGVEALSSYAALREADGERGELRRAVIRGVTDDGKDLGAAGSVVVREGDDVGWDEVWDLVRGGAALDPGIVVASLGAGPKHRAMTYWGLAIEAQKGEPLAPAIDEALRTAAESQADTAVPEAVVAFELLSRARGAKPREDLAWARSIHRETRLPGPLARVARLLTDDERRLLVDARVLSKNAHEARADNGFQKPPLALTSVTPYEYPRGFVSGLVAAAGCRPRAAAVARARITYDRMGQMKSVSASRFDMPDECAQVAKILLLSSHLYSIGRRSPAAADGSRLVHIGFLEPDELACLEETEKADTDGSDDGTPIVVGGDIKDPRKLRHVQPLYPVELRQKRVEGLVILETTLNPCGQVSDIEILRGVEGLNEPAAAAVRQWRFTPTLLNGRPVSVIYTVTVNFALQ